MLDEASSLLCYFNTPDRQYKLKRSPFGIKSAPEVFQKTHETTTRRTSWREVIIDDVLVWGENNELHDEKLVKLLENGYWPPVE